MYSFTYQCGHFSQNILLGVFQIVRAFDRIDISNVGDIRDTFGAIVDTFNLRDIGDIIDDDCLMWCLDNLLHEIRVRAFVNDFPCICASIVDLSKW